MTKGISFDDTKKQSSLKKSKLELIQSMCKLYSSIIVLVFLVACLKYSFPILEKTIFRDEVGIVAFICFVSIQIIFEVENSQTLAKNYIQYYAKLIIYVIDACIMINGRVKAYVTMIVAVFALIQMAYMYHSWTKHIKFLESPESAKPKEHNYQVIGTLTVLTNLTALILVMFRGTIPCVSADYIKLLITCTLVMYYFNVIINTKAEAFMDKSFVLLNDNPIYHAFRLIRPVGQSLTTKIKKLKKIKFR
jgi:hypothetical protein